MEPLGFVPTEYMPLALASAGGKLYVTTDKGKGTGPNNFAQRHDGGRSWASKAEASTYIATLLYGSLAALDESAVDAGLKAATAEVMESNRMKAAKEKIAFAGGGQARSST